MEERKTWFWRVIYLAIAIFFGVVGVGVAKTIIIDGDGSEWVTSEILTSDPDESWLANSRDLAALYFSNDTTNLFWRSDTHANSDYSNLALIICMDTDADISTGVKVGELYCAGSHPGADIIILVDPTTLMEGDDLVLFTCDDAGSCTPNFDPNGAYAFGTSVTEVRMSLAEAGVPGVCAAGSSCTMTTSVVLFKASNSLRLDSTVPATILPDPTVIDLSEFTAISEAPEGFWVIVAVFTSLALIGGWWTWQRYGQPQTGE